MALNAKNKLRFVDGSIPQPIVDDLNANMWSRCNSIVISWLLNVVSKDIADSLLYLDTAQAVWKISMTIFVKAMHHGSFKSSNSSMSFYRVLLI